MRTIELINAFTFDFSYNAIKEPIIVLCLIIVLWLVFVPRSILLRLQASHCTALTLRMDTWSGSAASAAMLFTLIAACCLGTSAAMQPIPLQGSGDGETPYDALLRDYPNQVRQVLDSFDKLGHAHRWYALKESDLVTPEQFCSELLNKSAGEELVKENGGCRAQLECTSDPKRFPPIIVSGRCLNNYCGRLHTGNFHPCRPQWRRVVVMRYFPSQHLNSSSSSNELQSSGQWKLRRERIISQCYCGV